MNYILFDNRENWFNLLPLTFTRPVSGLRAGILTIREKWNKYLGQSCSYLTTTYLQEKYPCERDSVNLLINSSLIPDPALLKALGSLTPGTGLFSGKALMAVCLEEDKLPDSFDNDLQIKRQVSYTNDFLSIRYPWDLFRLNGDLLSKDFELITRGRQSHTISSTNKLLGEEQIFAEEGASLEHVTLNATTGPVYLGRQTEIMEGTAIRGPFALCDQSTVKLNAKIYGPTTIGPGSKVGGEINNSVILGYTNKAHDGFLGNSVLGEWCNIGADSNNSNLKNNYSEVRLWNYLQETFINTGLQFCGLIMGDHTKCGINTMFNTGTVVGVSANVFGTGFLRNFVPSFSWGGVSGFSTYTIDKALEVASLVMSRRDVDFNETERKILETVFQMTAKYRRET